MLQPRRDSSRDEYDFVLYRYEPSQSAAGLFVALFAITSIVHTWQLFRTKKWNMLPLVIGGYSEIGGYASRIVSAQDKLAVPPYIAQTLLLLIPPILFAATIYMTLHRTVLAGSPHQLVLLKIPVRWITRIFVCVDIISLMMQGAGGGIMSGGGLDQMKKGENLVLAGLFVQIAGFVFFIAISVQFDRVMRERERGMKKIGGAERGGMMGWWKGMETWRKMLYALYVGSALILVRSVFRVVEYAMGNAGYLMAHEVFLYVFDAVLMVALMGVFNAAHPGWLLPVGETPVDSEQVSVGGDEDIEMGSRMK